MTSFITCRLSTKTRVDGRYYLVKVSDATRPRGQIAQGGCDDCRHLPPTPEYM